MESKLFNRFVQSSVVSNNKTRFNAINKLIYVHRVNDLLDELEENYIDLKNEFFNNSKSKYFINYPVVNYHDNGWKVSGIVWRGNKIKRYEKNYPILTSIVKKYGDLIQIAGYSLLESNSVIHPHRDDIEQITCHLALKIPVGDCRFKIGDCVVEYNEGKTLMFYSNDWHEAWNKTNEDRYIIAIELKDRKRLQKFFRIVHSNFIIFYIKYFIIELLFKPTNKWIKTKKIK